MSAAARGAAGGVPARVQIVEVSPRDGLQNAVSYTHLDVYKRQA